MFSGRLLEWTTLRLIKYSCTYFKVYNGITSILCNLLEPWHRYFKKKVHLWIINVCPKTPVCLKVNLSESKTASLFQNHAVIIIANDSSYFHILSSVQTKTIIGAIYIFFSDPLNMNFMNFGSPTIVVPDSFIRLYYMAEGPGLKCIFHW